MKRIAVFGVWAAAWVLPLGCHVPSTDRNEETARFHMELDRRAKDLRLDPETPLTMERCEEIALRNNLEYRVRRLEASLQDENVKATLAGFMPKGDAAFSRSHRSNEALMTMGGGPPVKSEDQTSGNFDVRVYLPILDWGAAYYARQIAKERRQQELLLVDRARQLLIREVRLAYAQLAAQQRQEVLIRIGLLATKELLKVAQSLEREGLTTAADTAAVEAGLAQNVEQWSGARRGLELSRLALAQVMSLPAGTAFEIVTDAPPKKALPTPAAIRRLEDAALRNRPETAVQDRTRRMVGWQVRERIARMLPQAASTGGFSWSSASQFTNPSFFRVGLQVTNSLLEGGAQWPLLQRTKKSAEAEAERSFLLALGILYQVDFAALHLYAANDAMVAREALLRARQETLRLSASRYAEGLETGAEMVRTLAGVCQARLLLDVAQTDYQLAGYELEAVAPEQPGEHQPQPETHAAIISAPPPREFQPLPATTETEKIWEVLSTPDVRHFPELQYLLNTAPKTEERKNDAAQQDEGKKTNP